MNITLLCSDASHPVNDYLYAWIKQHGGTQNIQLVRKKADATGGDILFLISCAEIITSHDRSKYRASLVLHASDLPLGRGWSPHIWGIERGDDSITLSLLEAEDKLDSGRIWRKTTIPVPKHALWNEINHLLFEAEIAHINFAVENFDVVVPYPQSTETEPTYFAKRSPANSKIDPEMTIAEQFNLIRVCDPNRFPAYFEHLGHRYTLKIEKSDE